MNLLRPIFSCLVNKIFHYIVMLFLCYVFPFASKDFVFPLLHWSIRGFKLERIYKKKSQRFFILCRMEKLDLLWGTNVLLFDVLTISIGHFVLFFSILSQKKKKKKVLSQKEKQYSVKLLDFFLHILCLDFFLHILCRMDIYFTWGAHNLSKWHRNEYKQHVICYSAIKSLI